MMNLVYFFAFIGVVVTAAPAVTCGVHMMPRKIKLHFLRVAILVVATLVIAAARCGIKAAKPFQYPLYWLRHYVWGSGKAMQVPNHILKAAKEAFIETLRRYYEDGMADNWTPAASSSCMWGAYHCLYHSTIYEGSGFYERPTLFYLLGGFTFLLRRDGLVAGKDRYDWHPSGEDADGKPRYFTSPLGKGAFAAIAMTLLNFMFGNDWFVCGGFPCGEHGISNKLWDDLHEVGARPFWSWFDKVSIFTEEDLAALDFLQDTGIYPEDVQFMTFQEALQTAVTTGASKEKAFAWLDEGFYDNDDKEVKVVYTAGDWDNAPAVRLIYGHTDDGRLDQFVIEVGNDYDDEDDGYSD